MSPDRGSRFVRAGLLAIWGMSTLVLVFCLVLLVNEFLKRGENPLTLPQSQPERVIERQAETTASMGTQEVLLYFADAGGAHLEPKTYRIDKSDSTVENCKRVLEALIRGPGDALFPILPSSATLRGIYLLEGGELVIDFSRELEMDSIRSASAEVMMVYGVVNTLAQPAVAGSKDGPVRRVRFLIEGAVPQDRYPAHLDLSLPVSPRSDWESSAPA